MGRKLYEDFLYLHRRYVNSVLYGELNGQSMLIERILAELKTNLKDLRSSKILPGMYIEGIKEARRYVERTLHIMIEGCIDVAQHIISDEQLREPTSYRDTFAVLAENGILLSKDLPNFEKIASFRNLLLHYYERVDDAVVYGVFRDNLGDFEIFINRIVEYLSRVRQA